MTTKDRKIAELREWVESNQTAHDKAVRIREALKTHAVKLVDKRFFDKHFTTIHDGHAYVEFSLSEPTYSFETGYVIYLQQGERIHVPDRTTAGVLEAVERFIELKAGQVERHTAEIATLAGLDESALVGELLEIYKKYGRPAIWRQILESFEVKYPADAE